MNKPKPMPVSQERFLSLVEAFLEFSKAWGIKVMVVMEPCDVEKKEKASHD